MPRFIHAAVVAAALLGAAPAKSYAGPAENARAFSVTRFENRLEAHLGSISEEFGRNATATLLGDAEKMNAPMRATAEPVLIEVFAQLFRPFYRERIISAFAEALLAVCSASDLEAAGPNGAIERCSIENDEEINRRMMASAQAMIDADMVKLFQRSLARFSQTGADAVRLSPSDRKTVLFIIEQTIKQLAEKR